MSYKVAFFGVPTATPLADVLAQAGELGSELSSENGYDEVYLATTTDDDARRAGMRPLYFAAPGARGGVPRGFFTERWNGPLFELVYDDQHGIFLWRQHGAGPWQSILTDGHRVGLSDLAPSVDYPQKGFTNEQLDAACRKPEDDLTDAEARAVMEYHDAITIGLAHNGFAMKRHDLLTLLDGSAYALLAGTGPAPLPRSAGPIASYYIEPHDFSSHDLPSRDY